VSTIRFMPPLTISPETAEEGLDIFDWALTAAEGKFFNGPSGR
jgi:4-aminobutyrate aminotransferase-like enzyme